MSVSTLAFSATLPPFNYTNGFNNNFSNTNLSATGNVSVATGSNSSLSNSATVTGSVTANGVNFYEKNTSVNGNTITVQYQSNEVNTGVTSPSTVNINSGGVQFSPKSATTNGSNVTTTYSTNPNSNFNVPINGTAYSTSNSTDHENITLKSLSLVGNTLTATYQFNANIPDNTVVAPHDVPVIDQSTATVAVATQSSVNNGGATFDGRSLSTIGDVLASSSGISTNGTLTGALQQPPSSSQSTSVPHPNATLAAVLNPSLSLSPSTNLSVSDFIDTSLNAFPTSAPADTFSNQDNNNNSNNSNNSSSTFSNTGNSSQTTNTRSTSSSSSSNFSSSSNNLSNSGVGIYNAISNANASTIRGTGVNTVA